MKNSTSKQFPKQRIILVVLLFISYFIAIMGNTITGSASFPAEFYQNENISWEIDNISSGTTTWYNMSDYSTISTWYANKSDIITFNITDWKQISEQNYLLGDLSLGNLTITTDNQDIGFNLVLSIYPWYGGLIALEQDWNGLSGITPFTGNMYVEINYDKLVTVLNQRVEAIEIIYDEGLQKTNLIYEPITGILLSANTTFGSFWLQMHLNSSTVPLPSVSQSIGFKSFIVISSMGVAILLLKKKRIT
ncbi:MAG TPA: hypothetical protein VMZ29_01830 [Candidatus Bathyarchaeia archaeon]|nr:hypothetical protein [Candidatus Bathyarchaeia archaeon]